MPTLDQFKVTLTWKQIVKILTISTLVIGGYYKMLTDIERATRLPESEVTRAEYNLKFEVTAEKIKSLTEKVARQQIELDRLHGHAVERGQ